MMLRRYTPAHVEPGMTAHVSLPCAPWEAPYVAPPPPPATPSMRHAAPAILPPKSGVRGIIWRAAKQRWQVTTQAGRQRVYHGLFDNLEDAKTALLAAKAEKR